jgi:hypothetical protein
MWRGTLRLWGQDAGWNLAFAGPSAGGAHMWDPALVGPTRGTMRWWAPHVGLCVCGAHTWDPMLVGPTCGTAAVGPC